MTIVTKRITFDAAHILTNHAGLCKNLHGHTYHVDISLADTAADTERSDMVMDFKEIKQLATRLITDRFDHAFIYNTASPGESEIGALVESRGMRTVPLPFRSTAENLAKLFYDELKAHIPALVAVKVWETQDSSAEYRA